MASQPPLADQKRLRFGKTLIADRSWTRAATVQEALSRTPLLPPGRIAYLEARVEMAIAREDRIGAKSELETLLKVAWITR